MTEGHKNTLQEIDQPDTSFNLLHQIHFFLQK